MTLPAGIHSQFTAITPITLRTTVGYLLHKRVTLPPGQKHSQLPVLETCSVPMSSVLQSPSERVSKSLKAQDAAVAKLLMSWGSMASPVLTMQAASQGTQPSTPSSRGHWPALVSPLPWSLWAWRTMEGGQMAWLWAPGREAWAWCGMKQLSVDTFAQGHYKDSARQAGFAATKC